MIIVVGGSLGGTDALRKIICGLPANFPVPIAVVLHRHRDSAEILAPVLQRGCDLRILEAEDKMPLEPGSVYLAPPDYQLMFDDGVVALSIDELVNFARPSIDVLFESAAEWKGREVVAIVLTGASSDGAAGAKCVQQHGGLVMVQDPASAEGAWMPNAAIAATEKPLVLSLEQIAAKLLELTAGRVG